MHFKRKKSFAQSVLLAKRVSIENVSGDISREIVTNVFICKEFANI